MYFGDHLSFNQIGFEDPSTNPVWKGDFDFPAGSRTHNWGWYCRDGELRDITRVRRKVTRLHPIHLVPLNQEMEITDEHGDTYLVRGEAIGFAPIPGWHKPRLPRAPDPLGGRNRRRGAGPAQTFGGRKAVVRC